MHRASASTSKKSNVIFVSSFEKKKTHFFNCSLKPRFIQVATGEEAKNYDFVAARPSHKRITFFEGLIHYLMGCLGGGVLVMHTSFAICGLWTAFMLTIAINIFMGYSLYTLIVATQRAYGRLQIPVMSYADIAQASFEIGPFPSLRPYGTYFRYLVAGSIWLDLILSCACYQLMVARAMENMIYLLTDVNNNPILTYNYYDFYIILFVIACLNGFTFIITPSLEVLAPFTMANIVCIISVGFLTMVYAPEKFALNISRFRFYNSITGLFNVIGISLFSYDAVACILPIENTLVNPRKMKKILMIGSSITLVLTLLIGFLGHWGYDDNLKSPITANFKWSFVSVIIKLLVKFILSVRFIVSIWKPFHDVWCYIKRWHKPKCYCFMKVFYKILLVLLIFVFNFTFPTCRRIIALIGTLCGSMVGLVYPAIIDLLISWDDPGLGCCKWRFLKSVFFVVTGLCICFVGTWYNIYAIVPRFSKIV